MTTIQQIPFFSKIKSEKAIENLASLFKYKEAKDGEVIIREGDPGDAFYIILRGECYVSAKRKEEQIAPAAHVSRASLSLSKVDEEQAQRFRSDSLGMGTVGKKSFAIDATGRRRRASTLRRYTL